MNDRIKRTTTAILTALLAFSMTACQPERTGTGLPKRNPERMPQQTPDRQETPRPIAGDPQPENERTVYMRVACAPGAEYVEIEWQAGHAQGGHIPERRCSNTFEKTVRLIFGDLVVFTARWTQISFDQMQRRNVTGDIQLLVKVNNKIVCDVATSINKSPRGVTCPRIRVE